MIKPLTVSVLKGDIFLTSGASNAATVIRRCQRTPGEPTTIFNHCGVAVESGPLFSVDVVEALVRVKRHSLVEEYGGTKDIVMVVRRRFLTDCDRQHIASHACSYVGRVYGVQKLLAHGADTILSRLLRRDVRLFRRFLFSHWSPICVWIPAYAYYYETGIRFNGVMPNVCQPDDIADDVTRLHDCWTTVLPPQHIPRR